MDINNARFKHGLFTLLLNNSDFFASYENVLKEEYFDLTVEKLLWKNLHRYFISYGKHPSVEDFILYLQNKQKYKIEDIWEYLENLPDYHEVDSKFYADQLMEFIKATVLENAIRDSEEAIVDRDFDTVIKNIQEAQSLILRTESIPESWYERLPERIKYMSTHFLEDRIATGFETLDRYSHGGLKYGDVGMIAASYGTGKSVFLLNIAKHAFCEGKKVLFITMVCELGLMEQEVRLDCLISHIPSSEYADNIETIQRRLLNIKQRGGDIKFVEWVNEESSITDLNQTIIKLAAEGWLPDVVVIDYLDLIKPRKAERREDSEIETLWRDFKVCAKQHRFVGWSASQLNAEKALAKSKGKQGVLDVGIKLLETPPEVSAKMCRLVCFKNRNGIGDFIIPANKKFDIHLLTESSLSYDEYKAEVGLDEYMKKQRDRYKK